LGLQKVNVKLRASGANPGIGFEADAAAAKAIRPLGTPPHKSNSELFGALWPGDLASMMHDVSAIETQVRQGTRPDRLDCFGQGIEGGNNLSRFMFPYDGIGLVFATFVIVSWDLISISHGQTPRVLRRYGHARATSVMCFTGREAGSRY
jgi:hypothetical protein